MRPRSQGPPLLQSAQGGGALEANLNRRLGPIALAGAGIVLTTAVVLGGLAALGARELDARALTASIPDEAGSQLDLPAGDAVVRALATTNVYAQPDRSAELVAVLPGGQPAAVEARSPDGEWLRLRYPAGGELRGWAPAGVLAAERGDLAALPLVAAAATTSVAGAPPQAEAPLPAGEAGEERLPDLTVVEAFLLEDGRLAVSISNGGPGALIATTVPVRVTRAEGDILGVLRIGPTTLLPGARATVVTPVVVREPGNYEIVLDAGNQIDEAQESNNTFVALLIPKG